MNKPTKMRPYGKIPTEIGSCKELTDRDVRVYWALAQATRGNSNQVNIGTRRIAQLIHKSLRDIGISLKHLIELGHVTRTQESKNKRPVYALLSPWFSVPRTRPAHVWHSRPLGVCVKCRVYRHLYADEHCAFCRKVVKAESAARRAREVAA